MITAVSQIMSSSIRSPYTWLSVWLEIDFRLKTFKCDINFQENTGDWSHTTESFLATANTNNKKSKSYQKNLLSVPQVGYRHKLPHRIWKWKPRNETEDGHNPSSPTWYAEWEWFIRIVRSLIDFFWRAKCEFSLWRKQGKPGRVKVPT